MREKIYEIPVRDAFADARACPFCRLRAMLERNEIERISGAAMMEPDVRIETNREGFCARHFEALASCQKVLPLALMLESHLAEVVRGCTAGSGKAAQRQTDAVNRSCYVCSRADEYFAQMLSAFSALYRRDEVFRASFAAAEGFCLPHYGALLALAERFPKKERFSFTETLTGIERRYLSGVKEDISDFCKQFDYRSSNLPPVKRDAPERAIFALVGGAELEKEGEA